MKLTDALTPDISNYRARRASLAKAIGSGVAVIPTAHEQIRNRDTHYPYRFDSYFYYLTGFVEPEAVLVIVGGAHPRTLLFCREKNQEREIWDGFRYGPEAARERFAFDEAHAIETLDEALPELLEDQPALFYPVGAQAQWDARAMTWLNAVRARVRSGVAAPDRVQDVRTFLDDMRLIKDAHELQLMRRAASISGSAHRRAMQARHAIGEAGKERVRD
jgi:Xaa-Pro aminopeptidase